MPKTDSSPAKKSLTSWTLDAPPATSLPMLKATPEVKKILTSAMHNLAHAAEYFLQVSLSDEVMIQTLNNLCLFWNRLED